MRGLRLLSTKKKGFQLHGLANCGPKMGRMRPDKTNPISSWNIDIFVLT